MELLPELRFARGNSAEKERRGIAVLVNEEEAAPCPDILFRYQANTRAFSTACFPKYDEVHGAARFTQSDALLGHRFLHHLKPKRHAVAFRLRTVPPLCAVPK
jgi:hypothetical protein